MNAIYAFMEASFPLVIVVLAGVILLALWLLGKAEEKRRP